MNYGAWGNSEKGVWTVTILNHRTEVFIKDDLLRQEATAKWFIFMVPQSSLALCKVSLTCAGDLICEPGGWLQH